MKRKFFSAAKKHKCTISNYKTEKSDMGWQQFFITIINSSGQSFDYYDSYVIGGNPKHREDIIVDFYTYIETEVLQH